MAAFSACLKSVLITGIVVCTIDFLLMGATFVEFAAVIDVYDANAAEILNVDVNATTNFNATSEWFTSIAAEYDALSNFDKQNVYCDVESLLASPEAQYDDVIMELYMLVGILFAMGVGLVVICATLCCCSKSRCNPYYGVIAARGSNSDRSGAGRATIDVSATISNEMTDAQKAEADLTNFNSNTAILFIGTGAGLAILWALVERRSLLTGLDCQDFFYECGKSGKCDIDDMVAPVALNSSMIKMLTTYPLIASAWFFGVACLVFVLVSGIVLSVGTKNFAYLKLPLFWSLYSILPFLWMLFLGDKLPFAPIFGALAVVIIPIIVNYIYLAVSCWWGARKYDLKNAGRLKY